MNVRIEDQNLRFKISEEELEILLNGGDLKAEAMIVAQIKPSDSGDDISVNNDGAGLVLNVPKPKLLELSGMGKSRDGLSVKLGDLSLSLQVDIRKDSRKRS